MTSTRLHDRLVAGPGSVGERSRRKRWQMLAAEFPAIGSMDVLDLGGRPPAWLSGPVRPASVHCVNLNQQDEDGLPPWIRCTVGDACDLPASALGRYDLVYSNSVLEHVGGHLMRQRFADTVHKMAPAHWVQAPYRYFPVEPHYAFPGFQFLPATARAFLAMHWPLRCGSPAGRPEALAEVLWVELPSRSEMRLYFPGSQIRAERLAGLPKSLIAVRH